MTDSVSSFLCPITRELMIDPVIDPDGNSYERSAIENWLKQHSTSPIVRLISKITKKKFSILFTSRLVHLLISKTFVQIVHYVQVLKNIEINNHHQRTFQKLILLIHNHLN